MAKKNALGRGLGALIEEAGDSSSRNDTSVEHSSAPSNEIEIRKIEVNPFQPRTHFDEDALVELATSIKEIGVIQPITVRQLEVDRYQLITGERRLRAARIAGLTEIPAYIRKANDQGLLEMALVENIQREDLDAIEISISYQRLIEECDLTQENLSLRVGKKRSTITNYLRLLKLPPDIQIGIKQQKLTMGHARALVNIEDPEMQTEIFKQIIEEDLSVRSTEELVRKSVSKPKQDKKNTSTVEEIPEEYKQLKEHLTNYFNTQIEFKRNNKGKGKIVINFNNDEELEKIVGILDKSNA